MQESGLKNEKKRKGQKVVKTNDADFLLLKNEIFESLKDIDTNLALLKKISNLNYEQFRITILEIISKLDNKNKTAFVIALKNIPTKDNKVVDIKKHSILLNVSIIQEIDEQVQISILKMILKSIPIENYVKEYGEAFTEFILRDVGADFFDLDITSLDISEKKKMLSWFELATNQIDDKKLADAFAEYRIKITSNTVKFPDVSQVSKKATKTHYLEYFDAIHNNLNNISDELKKMKNREDLLNNRIETSLNRITDLEKINRDFGNEIREKNDFISSIESEKTQLLQNADDLNARMIDEISVRETIIERLKRENMKEVDDLKFKLKDELTTILKTFNTLKEKPVNEYHIYYEGLVFVIQQLVYTLKIHGITIED